MLARCGACTGARGPPGACQVAHQARASMRARLPPGKNNNFFIVINFKNNFKMTTSVHLDNKIQIMSSRGEPVGGGTGDAVGEAEAPCP